MGNSSSQQQGSTELPGLGTRVVQVFQKPFAYFLRSESTHTEGSLAGTQTKKRKNTEQQEQSPRRKRSKSLEPKHQKIAYVNLQSNGRWHVQYPFEGKGRSLGSYGTKEDAVFALEFGKSRLESVRGKTNEEVLQCVRQARNEIRETLKARRPTHVVLSPVASALQPQIKTPEKRLTENSISITYVSQLKSGRWKVQYRFEGKGVYMGTYATQEDAVCVLDFAKSKLSNIREMSDDQIASVARNIRDEAPGVLVKMSKQAKELVVQKAIKEESK